MEWTAWMTDEVQPSIDQLRADGYTVDAFAYPYGSRTDETDRAVLDQVKIVRSVSHMRGTAPRWIHARINAGRSLGSKIGMMRLCALAVLAGSAACATSATHTSTLATRCARRAALASTGPAPRATPRATRPRSSPPESRRWPRKDLDAAKTSLDAAEQAGPLDHHTNITLWEQRGIAAAYGDDEPTAQRAFDMMLALDPGHFLSYTLSPKATFVFERTRKQAGAPPEVEINWARGSRVGDPLPLDVAVVADPKRFLDRATRVRADARRSAAWHAADLKLDPRASTRASCCHRSPRRNRSRSSST